MQWLLSRSSWRWSCIWWSLGCCLYFSEMRPASSRLGFCTTIRTTFPYYVSVLRFLLHNFRIKRTVWKHDSSLRTTSVLWIRYGNNFLKATVYTPLLYLVCPLQWKTINERSCSFVHFSVQTVGMQATPIVINNGSWWIRKAGCEDIDQVLQWFTLQNDLESLAFKRGRGRPVKYRILWIATVTIGGLYQGVSRP